MINNYVVTCLAIALLLHFSNGVENFEYVGCFQDDSANRMLPIYAQFNSVYNCVKYCQDNLYLYAGLQNGHDCWCGNRLRDTAKYPKLTEDRCSTACDGNKDEKCGERSISSVFKTGLKAVLSKPDGTQVNLVNEKFEVQ